MASSNFKYRAFISYSHADKAVADWLHRALESYRVPAKLAGKQTPIGVVPARLTPIFKDREELAASGDLSSGLKDALAAAQFLIVIASPAAAKSRWVNEEVRAYKQIHGETRVLVVIASGEPGASALSGREDEECFPPAVRFRVAADGTVTGNLAEPIAADLREQGDGKKLATQKLIAGLTGLNLDDLVRREALRRQQRMTMVAAAASVLAVVMSVLTIIAVQARGEAVRQRAEAEHQRAEADGLVEFMLTDLRGKLEPVGRLDALDVVGQRALKYYAGQAPGTLDADALGRRSRALHLVGEVRNLRADSESALTAFKDAAATTGELLARDPNNGQRIFDHAQSVYWVGYVAFQRGQSKEAEEAFLEYKRYAQQLVKLDPKNDDWQMEESYAESNLGTLLLKEGRYVEAERAYASALQIVESVARMPGKMARQIEVGQMISWLAKARERLDRAKDAITLLHREVAVYQEILHSDPGNTTAKSGAAIAWASIGRLEMAFGEQSAALVAYRTANSIGQELLTLEPKNSLWRERAILARTSYAQALYFAGELKQSRAEHESAVQSLETLIRGDPKNLNWNTDVRSLLDLVDAVLLFADKNFELALKRSQEASERLRTREGGISQDFVSTMCYADLLAGESYARLGRDPKAIAAWMNVVNTNAGNDSTSRSQLLAIRFVAFKRLGRRDEATRIATLLNERGYRHPIFVREQGN